MEESSGIRTAIEQAERKAAAEDARSAAERDTWRDDWERRDRIAETELMPKLRPATVAEYARFVADYLAGGGRIRYVRSYPMHNMWVAREDFRLPGLYGAVAIDILVPKGVRYLGGNLGHCTLYFMDGPAVVGSGVELFNDVAAYLKGGAR